MANRDTQTEREQWRHVIDTERGKGRQKGTDGKGAAERHKKRERERRTETWVDIETYTVRTRRAKKTEVGKNTSRNEQENEMISHKKKSRCHSRVLSWKRWRRSEPCLGLNLLLVFLALRLIVLS